MKFVDYLNLLLIVLFLVEVVSIVMSFVYYFKSKKLTKEFIGTLPDDEPDENGKYPQPDYLLMDKTRQKVARASKKTLQYDLLVFGSATIINVILLITEHHFYSFMFAGIMLYFLVDTYIKLQSYED